jgi:16S rRNA processing protein RimM
MSSDLVLVAKFGAPHGVRGEVRVKSFTQDPAAIANYSPLASRDGRIFTVKSVRPAGEVLVARIAELKTRDDAEAVTNLQLFVPRERIPAADEAEDEFLHADLIGLRVETATGEVIGTVTAVYDFGAGDMLDVARKARKSVMIPFTRAIVPTVDIRQGRVVVDPPEGLLEDTPRGPEDRD